MSGAEKESRQGPARGRARAGRPAWFRRRRGRLSRVDTWGWTPIAWQGWAVVAGFLILLAVGGVLIVPNTPGRFLVYCGMVLAVVIAYANICQGRSED